MTWLIGFTFVAALVIGSVALLFGLLEVIDRVAARLERRIENKIDADRAPYGNRLEHFVKVWNDSSDSYETAQRLGLSRTSIPAMALRARKAGYELKEHKSGRPANRQ